MTAPDRPTDRPVRPVRPARAAADRSAGAAPPELVAAWSGLLDAVEERTRRVEAYVYGGSDVLPAPLDLTDPGPLPVELAPRARALLARTRELEGVVAASRARSQRAFTYSRH